MKVNGVAQTAPLDYSREFYNEATRPDALGFEYHVRNIKHDYLVWIFNKANLPGGFSTQNIEDVFT